MKRIEDAASQLQRNVEQHCSIKENKGIAIKGAFRMFVHFLGQAKGTNVARKLEILMSIYSRGFISHVRTFQPNAGILLIME